MFAFLDCFCPQASLASPDIQSSQSINVTYQLLQVQQERTDSGTPLLLPGVPVAGLPAGSRAASVLPCARHAWAPRVKHVGSVLRKKTIPGGTFHTSP